MLNFVQVTVKIIVHFKGAIFALYVLVCLFALIMHVPVNIFSVMLGQVFLG